MPKPNYDRLREEFDSHDALECVDHLDKIRGILADGPSLEPPEIRQELMKLHRLLSRIVNEGRDPDEDLHELIWEIEADISEINQASEEILDALKRIEELCPVPDPDAD